MSEPMKYGSVEYWKEKYDILRTEKEELFLSLGWEKKLKGWLDAQRKFLDSLPIIQYGVKDLLDQNQEYKESFTKMDEQTKGYQEEMEGLRRSLQQLKTVSKFKKEYDPKWRDAYGKMEDTVLSQCTLIEKQNGEIEQLKSANRQLNLKVQTGDWPHNKDLEKELKELRSRIESMNRAWGTLWPKSKGLAELSKLDDKVELLEDTIKRREVHTNESGSNYIRKIKNQRMHHAIWGHTPS